MIDCVNVYLPHDIWPLIRRDRFQPDGRVIVGIPPMGGIWLASWMRQFVRAHHDLPIAWPDGFWVIANHELQRTNQHYAAPPRPLAQVQVRMAPHATALLRARAEADGEPMAAVLRRLLVQHFGRVPPHPVRVTGGAHVRTPGQGPDCTTCVGMIARS